MVIDAISIQRPLFQFFTIFNSFNVGEVVWEQYQQFAIPKIKNATKEYSEIVHDIPMLTQQEATEQLAVLQKVTKLVSGLRKKMEKEEGADFQQFKKVVLDFFAQLDLVTEQLVTASGQKDNVRAVFHHMTAHRKNPAIAKYLK